MTRPRVLIEDWLPIQELGIESRRESEIPSALPPIRFLHLWWARRPLVATAGVLLASLLPPWSPDLAELFDDDRRLATEESYRTWVLGLCGIHGDPISAKREIMAAKDRGDRIVEKHIYGYQRAYLNSPTTESLSLLHRVLIHSWGSIPTVLDPTAGGGSIPYEAARYGLRASCNDLNSVAAAVLRGGVQVAAEAGTGLMDDLEIWGTVLVERLGERLEKYFQLEDDSERVLAYIFSRAVACPRTGKLVPLAPNWWLSTKAGKKAAARLITHRDGRELEEPEFEILYGSDAVASQPDRGTVANGAAISPWDGLAISGDYIKEAARAGEMKSLLYAVAVRPGSGTVGSGLTRGFRPASTVDHVSLASAQEALELVLQEWLAMGFLPTEEFPAPIPKHDIRPYGFRTWLDFFTPRQLLVHGAFVEEFQRLVGDVQAALAPERAAQVLGLLALMQGKALTHDSVQSRWDPGRGKLCNAFERHEFAFKWTFAEFEAGSQLYPWCLDQLLDAYRGVSELLVPLDRDRLGEADLDHPVPGPVQVFRSTAGNLAHISDESQTLVCIDPPYYDNVMYGELSDFFGVWEQHTVGRVWPDLMPGGLADQKNEAVANVGRFVDAGRQKRVMADADYQAKMQSIFSECHRVLRHDGVLTVMFTHKRAEAWDTLGMALMEAGFTIETSWPVNTESESSLHQAKKNAATSTIMLVCRKRESRTAANPFFEDLEADVRRAARDAVEQFSRAGITGVDLLLSTYGPALSIISSQWPVYSSEADLSGKALLLRPEEALEAAREEVVRLQRRALIGRAVDLDPLTDFTLLAWSTFKAVEFPFDEARRLALAVGGLDVEELVAAKVLTKKAGTVVLLEPKARLRRKGDDKPGVRPDAESFGVPVIDAVHTALYVAAEDGLADAKALIDRAGLANDNRFLACVQGLVNAIPRTKDKGKWVRPESGLLDALVTAYFPDIEVPEEWTGTLDLGSA